MSSLSPIHSFNPIKIDQAFERFAHSPTEKKVASVALAVFAALAVIGAAAAILAGTGLLAGSLVVIAGVGLGAGALAAYIASVVFQFATLEKTPIVESPVREIRPQKEDMLQLRQDVMEKGREVTLSQMLQEELESEHMTTGDLKDYLCRGSREDDVLEHIKSIDIKNASGKERLVDVKNDRGAAILIDCGEEKEIQEAFDSLENMLKVTFAQPMLYLFAYYGFDKNELPSAKGPTLREIVIENEQKYLYMTMIPREQVLDDSTKAGNRFLEVMPAYTLRMNLEDEAAPVQIFQLDGIKLVDE